MFAIRPSDTLHSKFTKRIPAALELFAVVRAQLDSKTLHFKATSGTCSSVLLLIALSPALPASYLK